MKTKAKTSKVKISLKKIIISDQEQDCNKENENYIEQIGTGSYIEIKSKD